MNNFLVKTCVAAALTAMTVGAFAQGAGPTGGQLAPPPQTARGGHRINMFQVSGSILSKMDLTGAQKQQVEELSKKVLGEVKELRSDKNSDVATRQEKMKAIRLDYRNGLKSILTREEQKRYMALLKEYRKAHSQNAKPGSAQGKGGGTPPPVDR